MTGIGLDLQPDRLAIVHDESAAAVIFGTVRVAQLALGDVLMLSAHDDVRTLPLSVRQTLAALLRDIEHGARGIAARLEA